MNLPILYPFFLGDKPRVIGHRGAMGEAPENTLASFQKALDDGAPFLELDVHGSSDGEAVIIHDESLERTTDGQGPVRKRRLQELKTLDAGCRFTPDGGKSYPYRGRDAKIPTLKEFFLTFPRAKVIVELKQRHPPIAERVLDLIRELEREEQVLLATEDDQIMQAVRREIPKSAERVATGFSFGEVAAFFQWATGERTSDYRPPGQALQIPRKYGDKILVSRETACAAHEWGLELFVWTVNEVEEMKELLLMEVDGIITDYPLRLSRLLKQNPKS